MVLVQLSASTTETFQFSKDTYVQKGVAANYGTTSPLQFYTLFSLYLEMDISSISSKCPTSAFIKLYSTTSIQSYVTGKTVKATRIAANWDEDSVDGNFNPTKYESVTGSFVSLSLGSGFGNSYYTFDLSNAMLINAINTQSSKVWFHFILLLRNLFEFKITKKKKLSLYVEETTSTNNPIAFTSREGNTAQRPLLSVDYITCDPNALCIETGK